MIHYSPCNIICFYMEKERTKHPLLVEGNLVHTCISIVALQHYNSSELASAPQCLLPSGHKGNQSCGQCLHNFAESAYLKLQNVQWDCFSLISVTCIQQREQQERFQLVDTWHVDLTGVLSMMPKKNSIACQDYLLVLKCFGYLHFLYN